MRNGTRCDVLATHHAIEVEFASKWAESVGQSLNYSAQTGRAATIALILESGADEKYLAILRETIANQQLAISIILLKPFGKESLTMEFPDGFPKVQAQPVRSATKREADRISLRLSIDFFAPIAAMDFFSKPRTAPRAVLTKDSK